MTLTPRQAEVWSFFRGYCFARGYPPTLREVSAFLGAKTVNAARCHLAALVRKGLLRKDRKRYTIAAPELLMQPDPAGTVRVGSAGGPVAFAAAEWRAWLTRQLVGLGKAVAS